MSEHGSPAISVVVPCYNGEAYLRETLTSALEQTYAPLELLVIDDGSTDDSAKIAESFGSPVRVIRQSNQGESVARNRGFDEARGDWLAFLDADDLWKPTKLERQVELIDERTIGVHTSYYWFGTDAGVSHQKASLPPEVRYNVESAIHGGWCPSSFIVKRSIRSRFPEWTRFAEDAIFVAELVQEGEMRLVPEPLTGYRRHANSQSHSANVDLLWHNTKLEWLNRQGGKLSPEQIGRIRTAVHRPIVRDALSALRRGRIADYRLLKQSVTSRPMFYRLACQTVLQEISRRSPLRFARRLRSASEPGESLATRTQDIQPTKDDA